MSWIARSMAALGLLSLACGAEADPFSYSGYSVLNNQAVQLTDHAAGFDEYGGSGQITLENTNSPGGMIAVWCVDIPHWLLWSGVFPSTRAITGPIGDAINALLTNGVPLLGTDYNVSSALQIAIWKTM